jgi:hypothetical protein
LMAQRGIYFRLYQMQFGNISNAEFRLQIAE